MSATDFEQPRLILHATNVTTPFLPLEVFVSAVCVLPLLAILVVFVHDVIYIS